MKKHGNLERVRFGISFGILSVVYAIVAIIILRALGLNFSGGIFENKNVNYIRVFIIVLIVSPILEEFLFRVVPIKMFVPRTKIVKNIIIFLTSFVLFGWLHGGPQFMLVQGVNGLILAYTYLKRGYLASVVAHGTHNFIAVVLAILF